ncbi:MAG: aminoglycoside phosphotransferase family protein [Burkholderiaceae bacterium]
MADARRDEVVAWLVSANLPGALGIDVSTLAPASEDASFRRYFRVAGGDERTWIVMDAPPGKEDVRPFVHVASLLREAGLNAPEVIASDVERGFLLLSDLGTSTYLSVLDTDNASELFDDAIDALVRWQLASRPGVLPAYDRPLLQRELDLFPDWYVTRHRALTLSNEQMAALKATFEAIVLRALAQPAVYVHRDYMPRNLMVSAPNPGILDFQDAVHGPITYDIASLMRDAFISWDEERQLDWVIRYWERARKAGLPVAADFGEFWRDFEWMGLQRHLKVLGIFARINYRDGKPHYLTDTPRFIGYVQSVTRRYGELAPLAHLIDQIENVEARAGHG